MLILRPSNSIKNVLSLLRDALALLSILLLHLADRLFFPCPQRIKIYLGYAWERAVEARTCFCCSLTWANDLEAQDVREWDDMVVARLARERGRWIWWWRRGIDSDGIRDVTSSKQGTFQDVVMWCACDFDPKGPLASVKLERPSPQSEEFLPGPNRLVQDRVSVKANFLARAYSDLWCRNLARDASSLAVRHGCASQAQTPARSRH